MHAAGGRSSRAACHVPNAGLETRSQGFPMGRIVTNILNVLFAIIGLPLGAVLLGYGIYLSIKGQWDYGVFLVLLGVFLLGAVVPGIVRGVRAQPERKPAEPERKQPRPRRSR